MQTGLGSGVAGQAGTQGTAGRGWLLVPPARVLSDDEILGLDFSVKPRGSVADGEETGNGCW